jgi:hypothetical protein
MKVGDKIDELGVLIVEDGQLCFRRDAGGRWMLELQDGSVATPGTGVHLIGVYVGRRVVAVQELTATA